MIISSIWDDQDELSEKQEAFRALGKLQVHRTTSNRRKHLVFVQGTSEYWSPILAEDRSYDVHLNGYLGDSVKIRTDVETTTSQVGTKCTAVRELLEKHSELLLSYEYVLLLDDDIHMRSTEVVQIFEGMQAAGADLGQASLSHDSQCAWPKLLQPNAGAGITPLNTVEIMMPCLSRRALLAGGWAFGASVSGFGADILLGEYLRHSFGWRAVLFGNVVAKHTRPIDEVNGPLYRFLREHGIEPKTELERISDRFGISPGVWATGAPTFAKQPLGAEV